MKHREESHVGLTTLLVTMSLNNMHDNNNNDNSIWIAPLGPKMQRRWWHQVKTGVHSMAGSNVGWLIPIVVFTLSFLLLNLVTTTSDPDDIYRNCPDVTLRCKVICATLSL